MSKAFFLQHENTTSSLELPLEDFLPSLSFNQQGLIPAIAQQYDTKEMLMMAWMNEESIHQTLLTDRVCYWSRSRNKLWSKGEESGNIQYLKKMYTDCDGDAILLSVDQLGAACHTQRRNCFYWEINPQKVIKHNT